MQSGELKIETLNLSNRAYNCLKRSGYHTVKQIVSLTEKDLLKIKHLGKNCVKEIIDILDNLGISMTLEERIDEKLSNSKSHELER